MAAVCLAAELEAEGAKGPPMAAPPRAALALAAAVAASSITPTATAWQTLTIDKATPVKQSTPLCLPG